MLVLLSLDQEGFHKLKKNKHMNYILFDDGQIRNQLMPFTFTRPIAEIRVGIDTIRQKWERYLDTTVSVLTDSYLSEKYPMKQGKQNILINASVLPDADIVKAVKGLKPNQTLSFEDSIIAYKIGGDKLDISAEDTSETAEIMEEVEYRLPFIQIQNLWDIYLYNKEQITKDFADFTKGRKSEPISKTNMVQAAKNIFIEEGAKVEFVYLNANEGPIYIGKGVEIMEGAMLRGPLAIEEDSVIKMGAKIYGGTTIGPHCKVGGEVYNSVIFGYSNKAHDGFLGHSVLGEWCNLGADTNNSNLKNDYTPIKVWSYAADTFVQTGEQFCGLFMGDNSKAAINTMFNTGTVVGVSANVFGSGFPRQFVASFTWGGKAYAIDKALETVQRVYQRRGKELEEVDEAILRHVYNVTHKNRNKK